MLLLVGLPKLPSMYSPKLNQTNKQSINNDEDIDNGGDKDDPSPTGNSNNSRLSTLSSFVNCADGEIICLGIFQSAK